MKVYLAMRHIDYEGDEVLGVFATPLDAANSGFQHAFDHGYTVALVSDFDDPKDWIQENGSVTYEVEEWEVV